MEDSYSYTTVALVVRSAWYFLLFLVQQASVLRSFLVLGQLEMAALYLHNRLNTLNDRIESTVLSKLKSLKRNRFAGQVLTEYNAIVRTQRLMNRHCERCFYMYFVYSLFLMAFPIVLLFENSDEYFLIVFNQVSYFAVAFGIFLPPIYFNTYFTQAASFDFSLCSLELLQA